MPCSRPILSLTPQSEGLGFFSQSDSQTLDELFNEEPEGFVEDLTHIREQNPILPTRRSRDPDEGDVHSPKRSRITEYQGNSAVVSALSSQSYNEQANALTSSLEAVSNFL